MAIFDFIKDLFGGGHGVVVNINGRKFYAGDILDKTAVAAYDVSLFSQVDDNGSDDSAQNVLMSTASKGDTLGEVDGASTTGTWIGLKKDDKFAGFVEAINLDATTFTNQGCPSKDDVDAKSPFGFFSKLGPVLKYVVIGGIGLIVLMLMRKIYKLLK